MPNLNTNILSRVLVYFPSLNVQRKIAAILTAYDDLIETNKRRIALLENMAEELYREWFVHMRFPGYQNTKFVKGVPEGWPLQRFTELVFMNPRESIHKSDLVPYVGMDNLSASSMYFETNEVRQGAAGSKFRNQDSLLPRITPCLENGKRGFVSCLEEDQIGIGSTEFIVFREKVLPAEYIYLLSCNASFRQHAELSMTGASGRQRVQHDCFSYFFVPTPPQGIRNKFSAIISPMFESVTLLAQENVNLTQTRDLLLPRLISGKLSVDNLDIELPPSMREEAD
jgi:type I restriction enzyme, S subunit